MESLPPTTSSDLPPAALSFGVGGIEFFPIESIAAEQAGYVGPDWNEAWLVVARETACGDPIFVDRTLPALPVFTAMNGAGEWDPLPVAPSWDAFLAAIEAFRPFAVGRENPVGVEQKPLSTAERRMLEKALQVLLGSPLPEFWTLLIDEGSA